MTKKPLSSISFNTDKYLRSCLESLVSDGMIQSWMYILHQPEEDTKKPHIHLWLSPSRPVNPVVVRKSFIEPMFDGSGDLGCLPFAASKVSDWLLYALHYEPYLNSKGLVRQYHYLLDDIVSNECPEYVEQCFNEAVEGLSTSRVSNFISLAMKGATFGELLSSGLVPPNQVVFYDKLFRHYCVRHSKENCITDDVPF